MLWLLWTPSATEDTEPEPTLEVVRVTDASRPVYTVTDASQPVFGVRDASRPVHDTTDRSF